MKKSVIMMSVAFMCLTLVSGCGKNERRICEAKGDAWYWDGSDKTCKEKTDTDTAQGTDQTPSTNQTQGTSSSKGVKSDYFILVIPSSADNNSRRVVYASIPDTPILGFIDDNESISVVSVEDAEGCLKVHKSYLPGLKVTVKPVYRGGVVAIDVCGGSDTDIEIKCGLDVYELEADGSGLKKRSKTPPTDCKELKLEE
ncbi:MAG: hypothetical protein OXM55_00885 [Bdellovibrionales bacterium]|nr:hypothetical protein [Bdellovibrionales bacterium]